MASMLKCIDKSNAWKDKKKHIYQCFIKLSKLGFSVRDFVTLLFQATHYEGHLMCKRLKPIILL